LFRVLVFYCGKYKNEDNFFFFPSPVGLVLSPHYYCYWGGVVTHTHLLLSNQKTKTQVKYTPTIHLLQPIGSHGFIHHPPPCCHQVKHYRWSDGDGDRSPETNSEPVSLPPGPGFTLLIPSPLGCNQGMRLHCRYFKCNSGKVEYKCEQWDTHQMSMNRKNMSGGFFGDYVSRWTEQGLGLTVEVSDQRAAAGGPAGSIKAQSSGPAASPQDSWSLRWLSCSH